MRPPRSLSVLMPTWQGMEFLERVLDALRHQKLDLPWDFLAIDSGSTDGTWELLEAAAQDFPVPLRRHRIDPVEFDHGDTRNLLASMSEGELLVFLTQDAIPSDERFLAKLAANYADERVGAAYARNLPRPDAQLLTKIFSENDPGYIAGRREVRLPEPEAYASMNPHEKRVLYNFNDVASSIRRELWERHPFPRTWFGEDILMARAVLEAGFTVVYDDEATVEHSHDYDAAETRARTKVDGRFSAEWLGRICVASKADAHTMVERQAPIDEAALRAHGLTGEALQHEMREAHALRLATFEGLWEGGQTATRLPATRMLDETKLHILFSVHSFPPEAWAGTEIYTFNLALELQRLGHTVTVLTREDGDAERADFSVRETEFQGLRVLRLTHKLQHQRLSDSYSQPLYELAFKRILAWEKPDLVHFQHLLHTSVGLVDIAKRAGLPTVLHLHDYWALCSRVQLIRPDGQICDRNMGLGCYTCVKDTALPSAPLLEKMGRESLPGLREFARDAEERAKHGSRSERRWRDLGDMLERQPLVEGAYAAADLRVSPSRFLRTKLLESGSFDPHTLIYSDNGMRTDHVHALEKAPAAEGQIRFGFVGSLVWYKGGEVMVRAMQLLKGSAVSLSIHGSFDPEKDEHHAQLVELSAGTAVNFAGRFDNARLSEVYAEIDVLIVPSIWYENSPVTIHEAWLTGTPILCSDIGGMAEYVLDGVNGLHFETGSAEDLAAKMREFVEDPDLVRRLALELPPVKTIADNARETEFRYRALCSRERVASPIDSEELLMDSAGLATSSRHGSVDVQGADMLLIRPGPEGSSAAEYNIEGVGGGPRRMTFEVMTLGPESELELTGSVLIDGQIVGKLPSLRARENRDEVHSVSIFAEIPSEARRLRIEGRTPSGEPAYLRLKRIRIHREGMSE